mmetsp:Transcript_41129/g.110512  ORF Transcript_41129/g.110512 Transcript_41129/m.110512 type:complete len:434 (+) Transcript_41129:82-1383(+)
MATNCAFVFLKPLAVTDKMKELVKKTFEEKNIKIVKEGSIEADTIDKKQLIDKHYYAIASKATLLTPDKLSVPGDKFKAQFGLEWEDVLKDGKALNAKDACEKFGIDADELNTMWGAAKKGGVLVKLGGGFYCAKLEKGDVGPYYVFNGFFMTMRSAFTAPGKSIHYYTVEWDPDKLSWEDFRGKVLGPTDPKEAPKDSLRGEILSRWQELGLAAEPNVGDNGVHASASPFEATAERMNWLGYKAEKDVWGKNLLAAGVKMKTIKDWTLDPAVTYGAKLSPTTKSIWDTLEDMDSQECLDKCAEVAAWRPLRKPKFMKVSKLNPVSKSFNMYLKVVKGPVAVEGSADVKEVVAGDDTAHVTLSIREASHVAACTEGALLRVQNAHVKMIKGYIRVVVDKWGILKADVDAATAGFETVDDKTNMSATEYELVDK